MERVFRNPRAVIVLLGPALLVYIGVIVVPVCWSLAYSLFTGSPASGFSFVGLKNFRELFDDPTIRQTLWTTVKYALVMSIGQIILGYLLALFYLFVLRRLSTFIRTLVFFPVVLPTVAVALLFGQLFAIAPQTGPIDSLLHVAGAKPLDWFATGDRAFSVIIIMDLWRSIGLFAVILYVGLLDIPHEVIESARVDGAGGLALVRRIVVPMSRPILMASIIFALNADLKVFDSILALNNGGPGTDTTPLNLYMYQTSFLYNNWGYGAAIALLITLLCLLVTLLVFRSLRRDLTKG
ncbi:MAG TPA: sugar ABC transporter permease [Acidimicrobiales bacterium]|nr:sugar ABC transporter permease [Acidimicrobiales bacterium]